MKESTENPFISTVIKDIYAVHSYIPDGAVSQLFNLTDHYSEITHLFGMPDLHQGKRCPIGAVVITKNGEVHPDLVGEDIGCGMALYRTDKIVARTTERQLETVSKRLYLEGSVLSDLSALSNYPGFESEDEILQKEISWGNVVIPSIDPSSYPFTTSNSNCSQAAQEEKENGEQEESEEDNNSSNTNTELLNYLQNSLQFLGTIGAGNHFAELQEIDKLFIDPETALNEYGIDDQYYYLTVHSGSRGIGEKVLHSYQDGFLSIEQYYEFHNYCLDWAKKNRYSIACRFLSQLDCSFANCSCILDLSHNFCEFCSSCSSTDPISRTEEQPRKGKKEEKYVIHRKGAAPAYPDKKNLIIIPGSRGTHSYLVQATDQNTLDKNGLSVSHGAGRKISRTAAQEIMKECSVTERERKLVVDENIANNIIICEKKELYYEEAPFAYKDIDVVIEDLLSYGLVKVIASLKPVITYKTKNN
jgi:release factor H-coupled RctB family protein